ncbi:hypothetical protein PG993_005568 [Apiospora rasikravindrae]|uniref:Uncharacterized protein n=1 Tax=Apiospora rasikravindrae TaxID=990691 RepID=A0ABR1TIG5_9PEZI
MTGHQERYFANPTTGDALRTPAPHDELLASLERINTFNPPVHTCSTGWGFHGFYTGPTSIAYLFYRLSQLCPDLEFKQQPLIEWAQEYLRLGAPSHRHAPTASNCGIGNEALAHLTMTALLTEDGSVVTELCSYERTINDKTDDGSNEWLYGRAGYLYYLRLCKTSLTHIDHALINKTIEKTVRRMLKVPQPWVWHGKQYLGAAHGTIGTICQMVLSMPEMAPQLRELLNSVLDEQLDSGNFPSSLPAAGSDKLVQFCHGGPGFVLSLRSLRPYYPELETKMAEAIRRAQADIWRRGLLTKTPCLCHGIAGNALALDDQAQFLHLLSFMGMDAMESAGWLRDIGRGHDMASLYTGEAGRAWSWAVADMNLSKTCIGYNDV